MIPKTMKAAVAEAPGAPLVIRDLPVPQPGRGQFLVKLESCGVCHSDLHLRNGDEGLPDEMYPMVFGHEGIGRIVAVGEGRRHPFRSAIGLACRGSTTPASTAARA